MKKHNNKDGYTDEPIGEVSIIPDFLPSPEELILKEEPVEVTLSLSKESIEFFKKEAAVHNTHYQKLIRAILNGYADHYAKK